ncbi:MAG: hypothetical protein QHI38_01815 [Armatimonadota bacterium]|nr:hypothetical protein [Armatimonadota bacterium]
MRRIILLGVLVVSAAAYLIWGFATLDRRSDEVQIRSLIDFAQESIRDRNVQALMSCISRDYKDDEGLNYDRARLLAVQVFQIERPYDVTARIRSIKVLGKRAELQVEGEAQFLDDGEVYKRHLVVHLRKERVRHLWLIPTRVWKIIKVEGLGLDSLE